MSGIYGYMLRDQDNVKVCSDITRLEKWNKAYGSDGKDNIIGNGWGIGCYLNSVNDERNCSTPIFVRGSKVYVVDALLYNPEEIEEKIGAAGRKSFEELLIDYIERCGYEALKDVNGDFAGAIIDQEKWTVSLFRDHMGVRPLYYYSDEDLVVFSTDMRGLVALHQVDAAISEEWLFSIISGHAWMHPTNTEFASIYGVTPASAMTFSYDDNGLQIEEKKYWKIGTRKIKMKSEVEYQQELRRLITDSVRRRTKAISGLLGAELSGGLDSSIIDILINREGRDAIYYSWSISPEELPLVEADERYILKDICDQEGIECHYAKKESTLGDDSIIADSMRKIGMEADPSLSNAIRYVMLPTMNTMNISEASQCINRAGAKVVFTGHSGDEGVSHRCGGYEMFHFHEYYRYLRYMWSFSHGQKNRVGKTLKYCYNDLLGEGRKNREKEYQFYYSAPEILGDSLKEKFANKKSMKVTFAYDPIQYIRDGGSRNRLDVTALLGAYSGVQYIFPYVDYRVIDYAVSVPRYLYLRGYQNRYLFREAFKDIMPKSLYRLKNKAENSFKSLPDGDWKEGYEKIDSQLVKILTPEKWDKYLNFEEVNKWLGKGAPSEEDREQAEKVQYCLYLCALFENVVTRTRES